ncbi:hypothetical protein SCHPADRAFT_899663 [Schizopora paradoxa]|uniref:Uncharacterized protein n=1 Tax=Schizopora paradoxa TaxID=27342 RepID=A0A0H2S2A4_9AGAM|nr:hypothetical protein SCHPADRAFT_899663 [Schizopora paradoxa]
MHRDPAASSQARSAMQPGAPPGAQLTRPQHDIAHAPNPLTDLAVASFPNHEAGRALRPPTIRSDELGSLTTSSLSTPAILARVWVHHVHRNKPQRYPFR